MKSKFSDLVNSPFVIAFQPADDGIRPGDVGVELSSYQNLVTAMPYQDLDAWRDFIARWDVQFPIKIGLSVGRNGPSVFLKLSMDVPNSRTASTPGMALLTDVNIEVLVPTTMPVIGQTERWVRALLRWFVLHELDEWILIHGCRFFDPHADGKMPTPANS